MKGLSYVFLSLVTAASTLVVVLARRRLWAGLALGLNMASLAGIALTLSAPLVAVGLLMMGLGIALASLEALGRDHADDEVANASTEDRAQPGSGARRSAICWLGAILFVGLASALLAGDAPGWRSWTSHGLGGEEVIVAALRALYTRYGLGLVGTSLAVIAALIGANRRRDVR